MINNWLQTQTAESTFFSAPGFSAKNVNAAIVEAKSSAASTWFPQYQYIGTVNFDRYLFAFKDDNGSDPSGDPSNGYEFGNSAPIVCPFDGKITALTAAIKGVAVSTGNVGSTVTVNFELYNVGFQGEGTKIDDIDITFPTAGETIGIWWNASIDSDLVLTDDSLDIDVSRGDRLGLKFIRVQNNTNAVAIYNPTIVLKVVES